MHPDPINIGGIVVALIAAGGAWASQRAASKANTFNAGMTARLEAEKEAYVRARQYDIETINRQHSDIVDLREQLAKARERIAVLERGHPPNLERMLLERLQEPDSPDQE